MGEVNATPYPVDDNHDSSIYMLEVVITIRGVRAIEWTDRYPVHTSARELGTVEFDIGRHSHDQTPQDSAE